MVVYNFKAIQVVPNSKDFLDIVLSKTQKKTPTVVHPGYAISRIRTFYMRKVKFVQQSFHDRLQKILTDFPVLEDIHPFYADLLNVLYDRDHYKLALGQLNVCKNLIDQLGRDYARLLKYGDSLYRCKQLKRAGVGRMCTLIKKQNASLAYLEQLRQHLARLPSIDPAERTLLLCGFPNVGKSSFLNKITRADVDVQPYAFTTKSLFIGHTDHKQLRWQVIDTPGILDHPLEQRNTIEMQSITALAHLRAAIIFVLDISEQCDFTVEQQVALFESIKPLFADKPLIVALNKIDVIRPESLREDARAALARLEQAGGVNLVPMSNLSEEGVSLVKQTACDLLLAQRVEAKLRSRNATNILSRIHVAVPAPRDNRARPPHIPASVLARRAQARAAGPEEEMQPAAAAAPATTMDSSGTSKPARVPKAPKLPPQEHVGDLMLRWDGTGAPPGFNDLSWKDKYLLREPDWRYDNIPQIFEGKNVADYVDPDIMEALERLEQEEEERAAAFDAEQSAFEKAVAAEQLTPSEQELLSRIRDKKSTLIQEHSAKRALHDNRMGLPSKAKKRTASDFEAHLRELGIDQQTAKAARRTRSQSAPRRGRSTSVSGAAADSSVSRGASKSRSRSRGASVVDPARSGVHHPADARKSAKIGRMNQRVRNKDARKGEGDRVILTKFPKHLYSGKRGAGKTDRR